jgi:uncharacterized protein (DUF433 family)
LKGEAKFLMMEKIINVDKEILGGTPVFMGTRVPVKNLFDYLEEGEPVSEFLKDFPSVKKEQVDEVLKIAQQLLISLTKVANENIA